MTNLSVGNLVIYSAQVLLVVAAAAIGEHVVGQPAPRSRLGYWRAVVAACLLLPLGPRRADVVTRPATIVGAETVDVAPKATKASPILPPSLIPWLLLSGAAARAAWLGLGVLRLRRLRVQSVPATLNGDVEALRRTWRLRLNCDGTTTSNNR